MRQISQEPPAEQRQWLVKGTTTGGLPSPAPELLDLALGTAGETDVVAEGELV